MEQKIRLYIGSWEPGAYIDVEKTSKLIYWLCNVYKNPKPLQWEGVEISREEVIEWSEIMGEKT